MIRTRFAPSPTGYLHVGGLRTALYAYLLAKKHGGKFLLRIEDTDRERFVEGGIENILNSLYWAGIVPDEGVVLRNNGISQEGKLGPYIQSERLSTYKKYADELLVKGHAYYCFCTPERLDQLRKEQEKNKMPTGYDQHCLQTVSYEDGKKKAEAGERHVVRLRMPKEGESVFADLIRGEVTFKNKLIDDQVLLKSDGYPTYHLAVVVDDHEMEITHVVRGEEWISSTPKHIQLYKYFGWKAPEYAHLPLLLNPDKSKLSKRQGDVAVSDYEKKGYLPEALVNFVAFLGWNPGTEKELFTLSELINDFSLEKVNKTGAVFNQDKLNWYNKEYIKMLDNSELVDLAKGFFERDPFYKGHMEKIAEREWFTKVLSLEKERVNVLSELPSNLMFVFELPVYEGKLLIWRKGSAEELKSILPLLINFLNGISEEGWGRVELEKVVTEWIKASGFGTGNVLWPLRVSLSGQQNSPGPFEIAEVLGKKETLKRLQIATEKLL